MSSFSSKGELYDPIYHDSKQSNNTDMNTVYSSPGLRVISVTMFWGVALKLVRYKKEDPTDIVAMLRHGTRLNGVKWTPAIMETWIKTLCWPMGYDLYKPQQAEELSRRIHDANRQLKISPENSPNEPSNMALVPLTGYLPHMPSTMRSPPVLNSLHTMSNSLAPDSIFTQPPSASSLRSIPSGLDLRFAFAQSPSASPMYPTYMSSHSLSPPPPMGRRVRRSSTNLLRHPLIPLSYTSSHSSLTLSHSHSQHSHSQSPLRMPEPWVSPTPLLYHQIPSSDF